MTILPDAESREAALEKLVDEALVCKVFSKASATIINAHGTFTVATRRAEDYFDIASVTKVITTILALKLLGANHRVRVLQERVSVDDVAHHASGLPAWKPYYAIVADRFNEKYSTILASESLQERAKEFVLSDISSDLLTCTKPTYSDLGYLALGFELENSQRKALPQLLSEVIEPHIGLSVGAASWGDKPLGGVDTGTGRPRRGTVWSQYPMMLNIGTDDAAYDAGPDDDNAACMGAKTGHAGIWASSRWVAQIGYEIVRAANGASRMLNTDDALRMIRAHKNLARSAGLDCSRGPDSQIGTSLCEGGLGGVQTGFTGCSLCIDPVRGMSVALLSNAVDIERPSLRIRSFRPYFHNRIAEIFR